MLEFKFLEIQIIKQTLFEIIFTKAIISICGQYL